MTNHVYDKLKILALIVLPALVTLWVSISTIWGLPYTEEIAGTLAAIDTFLGALLKISGDKYSPVRELTEDEINGSHVVLLGDMNEEAK